MAFLGLKKKKEETLANPDFMPEYNNPVEQVQSMKQQGYTNDQIVQALQQQGYTMAQISEAMGQSSYEQQPQQDFFSPPPQYSYDQQQQYPQQGADNERVQEIVEAVIEEKWSDLVKDIKGVIEWRDRTEARLVQLQQQISDLKSGIDSVNSAVLGRLSDYDKSVTEVGTGIKAMEKVFQKVLPSLTDSINRLERVSKKD